MDDSDVVQLNIEVSAEDASEEELDRMTRQLLVELRDTDVESVELARGGIAPPGAKAIDPVTMGSIVISALPSVLPAVAAMVQAWAARGQGRAVKFKGRIGKEVIEFEGSPEELQKLIAQLQSGSSAESPRRTARSRLDQTPVRKKSTGSPGIFISYRRADSADVTGRIYDRLVRHFGKAAIFKDVHSIPAGVDFKEHLEKAVGKCKIFLVVIGDRWLDPAAGSQKSRLQDPDDFVRIEVEAALNRGIPVIPLLVRGTSMPAEKRLPSSLRKLVYRNALPVRPDPDFQRDIERLFEVISEHCG